MDFYADSGIPYTYTIELPDLGQYGFQLPESNLEEVRRKVYYLQSIVSFIPFFVFGFWSILAMNISLTSSNNQFSQFQILYLAHVIEQPIFPIQNLEYLQ